MFDLDHFLPKKLHPVWIEIIGLAERRELNSEYHRRCAVGRTVDPVMVLACTYTASSHFAGAGYAFRLSARLCS